MGGSNWEPDREQETLFGGGKTQERRLTKSYINSLYQELSSRTSGATNYDNFRLKGKWLYFKGRDEPLTNEYGNLKTFSKLKNILGKNRLCGLGFDVPKGKVTTQQAVMLNRVEEEMPSTSNIAEADDIELQRISLCNLRANPQRIYPCMNS